MNRQVLPVILAALVMTCGSAFGAPRVAVQGKPAPSAAPQAPTMETVPPASSQAPTACSQLPADQMAFMNQCTDMNLKMAFCSKMTAEQRQQVMSMMKQPDSSGNLMTADQAMQKFMQDNNMDMSGQGSPAPAPVPATTTPQRPSSGGSCPVK